MKKSRAVPLILLGTLSLLSACGRDETTEIKQHSYASREDCLKDWGRDERDCSPVRTGTGYMGPRYYWYHSGGYPVVVNNDGSTRPLPNSSMSRFGATSRAIGTTTSHISGHYTGGGAQAGGGHTSRGGFGGTAHGISGGA
jgi:hypothetical protein